MSVWVQHTFYVYGIVGRRQGCKKCHCLAIDTFYF